MQKKKNAQRRLFKSIKFSGFITTAIVGVGLAVSLPIYYETQRDLDAAIREVGNVNLGIDKLVKQLGLKGDQGKIEKVIDGGYKLIYDPQKRTVVVYKINDKNDAIEEVFSISPDGKIRTKYKMTGTAAKTIISVIALVKTYLQDAQQAFNDILVPFLKEIKRKEIAGGKISPVISKSRYDLSKNLVKGNDLLTAIDTDKSNESTGLKKWRKEITNLIVDFYKGYAFQRAKVLTAYNEISAEHKNNKFMSIINSTSIEGLKNMLKYQGWTMKDLLDYFVGVRYSYFKLIEQERARKAELEKQFANLERDKDETNIFTKIASSFGNTLVAISKTYDYKEDDDKSNFKKGSQSIRHKLFEYLEKEQGLKKSKHPGIQDLIKKSLKWERKSNNAHRVLDSSIGKKIIVGEHVYTVLKINAYKNQSDKDNKLVSESKYLMFKSNKQSFFGDKEKKIPKRIWDGSLYEITRFQEEAIIHLSEQVELRSIDVSKYAKELETVTSYILGDKRNVDIDYILNNIHKAVIWKAFMLGMDSQNVINTLDANAKKLKSYKPYVQRIINEFDGSTNEFTFKILDRISDWIYSKTDTWKRLLTNFEQIITDPVKRKTMVNYTITAAIQGFQIFGWNWIQVIEGKSMGDLARYLKGIDSKDLVKDRDKIINEIIRVKIGKT